MKNTDSIDCFQCQHFFITWDAHQPRGCRAFGFKTKKLPSQVVLESSGEPCLKFTPKSPPPSSKTNKTGWIA